jgi:hypothetical protein
VDIFYIIVQPIKPVYRKNTYMKSSDLKLRNSILAVKNSSNTSITTILTHHNFAATAQLKSYSFLTSSTPTTLVFATLASFCTSINSLGIPLHNQLMPFKMAVMDSG